MTNKIIKINQKQQNLDDIGLCFLPKVRLSWYSNEEIYSILNNYTETPLTNQVQIRPNNGSLFLYDRNVVKNFKKDLYTWKRRKDGGNSVREDRMSLKINGIDSIYGCYSHNSFVTTFHRRCYWLLAKPNIVLVHYLLKSSQQQQQDSNNSSNSGANISNNSDEQLVCDVNINLLNQNLKESDYLSELTSILWPYTLNNNNYGLIERLIQTLIHSNQLKASLKLIKIDKIYNLNCLNNNTDIPLIQIQSDSCSTIKTTTALIIQQPEQHQDPSEDDNDIYLSKTSITINNAEEDIIYIIIKNEAKYKLNNNLKYYIQLLNHLVQLSFINTTLLELKLNRNHKSSIATNSNQQHQENGVCLNTFLYFYDSNFNLIYKPFNFEVKFETTNVLQLPSSTTTTATFDDKYRLIILEKLLFVYNFFKLNLNIDFSLEFEQRLVSLVDFLKENLNYLIINGSGLTSSSLAIISDENKTLFHLTVLCNYKNLFESLILLFKSIQQHQSTTMLAFLFSELNPSKVDNFNLKAVDYARKHNYYQFVEKLTELEKATVTNEFILSDDLSWLNEINENNNEFPLVVDDDSHHDINFKTATTPNELLNNSNNNKTSPLQSTYMIDDDQDKKIKTLADNIIAAMPMKIKSNSYSFVTQTNTTDTIITSTPMLTTQSIVQQQKSFDLNDFRQNSIASSTNNGADDVYSPLSSIDNQSPSASNFHIDSTPSTAEFSKYFHAKKTYKSFENDFSQLTLTDDEQRELYEAALIIQNAYRRYLKRKHNRLNDTPISNSSKMIKTLSNASQTTAASSSSSSSLLLSTGSSTAAAAALLQKHFNCISNESINDEDEYVVDNNGYEEDFCQNNKDDDELNIELNINNNNSEDEIQNDVVDTKQYEAACIIQKYFRRYKQVFFMFFV